MVARVTTLLVLVAFAALLAGVGRWGRRHSSELVPTALPDDDRAKRAAVVRRGGLVCYAGAVVMATVGVLAVL